MSEDKGLSRELGLAECITITAGASVGVGLFTVGSSQVGLVGRSILIVSLVSLLLVIWPTMLYGEMAAALPLPGGQAAAVEKRLMSYNVRHCEGMDRKLDVARTAAAIVKEKPDYVGLQEVETGAARSQFIDEPAELAKLTGLHVTFAKAIPYEKGDYGNALLSRERPLSVVRIPLPGGEPRVLLLCEFADCVVGTTHLAVDSEKARTDSISLVREAVVRFSKDKPVFLSGDWNSLPDSVVLKGLGEFLTVLSKRDGQTYHGSVVNGPDKRPLDMTRFCIDYIAVDAAHAHDWRVLDARIVEDRQTSDHAPLVVTISKRQERTEK